MKTGAASHPGGGDHVLVAIVGVVTAECAVIWAGAELATLLHGTPGRLPLAGALGAALALSGHAGHPAAAWPQAFRHLLPGAPAYWVASAAVQLAALVITGGAWSLVARRGGGRRGLGGARPGFAPRREVRANLGEVALRRRAKVLRPSLSPARAGAKELGVMLGRDVASGLSLWGSHEDSYLLLGPPRSGKGASVIIPGVLETPGAAVVSATRPDTLSHTGRLREGHGPVAVFDPQGLSSWAARLAWSPVHGCEDPEVAILRGSGLAAGAGFAGSTTDADYWSRCAATVLQCYLHAAALAGLTMREVCSWAARPGDPTPVAILREAQGAAESWCERLSAEASADPRRRDSVFSGVGRALDCLANPKVLAACSPAPESAFDAADFLASKGTIYLLGSPKAQASVAPLVSALVEDLVETARRRAATSPGGRLDPPLVLWLDEAANIAPLPSLPHLLADGGGSGICTVMVLQSLAQARHRWGSAQADALWDAATLKVVLPGLAHAEDLSAISRLAGEVDEVTYSSTDGPSGRTTSSSMRRVPALPLDKLRNLAAWHAIVLHRRTPPVEALLQPWWRGPNAKEVRACADAPERRG